MSEQILFQTPGILFAGSNDDKTRVEGSRRRRSGPQDGGQRERASAPQRKRPSSGAGGTGGGTPTPRPSSGGAPQMPGGWGGLIVVAIVIIAALLGLPLDQILGGGSGGSGSDTVVVAPTSPPVNQQAIVPATQPPAAPGEKRPWTIMLYQDADDKVLEQDIYLDLNEAERIGSTDNMHIVAQFDRYQGGFAGDGDWVSTRRYYVTQDNDLNRVGSALIADLGEANMADGNTLVEFVTWAAANYPADKYVLIMSDHGMGWPGGWSDPTAGSGRDPSNPLSSVLGDKLYLMELDDALERAVAESGIGRFEMIGMDACLMAHLEVFSALQPHARYGVASQEVEPALGWAYTGFLEAIAADPSLDGAQLGRAIVDSYITEDQRIVDDQARAEYLRQGSPLGGLFTLLQGGSPQAMSAGQLAQQLGQSITLTVVDLDQLSGLVNEVNALAFALQGESQQTVARARSYAQSFTNVFGNNVPPSYIDLGHFAQLIGRESGNSAVTDAASRVFAAIDRAVVAEKHGPKKPGATGVSIYFPNSQLYGNPATGAQSYTTVARRFAETTLWDDFLAFHYTGRRFDAVASAPVAPTREEIVAIPGLGAITVSPIELSAPGVAIRDTVTVSADIAGDNVGYVYLFVGFLDRSAGSIFLADADYIESEETRELSGVYYPVWPEEDFALDFAWEPIVYAISDGDSSVVARFKPETYGASFADATYSVDGVYAFADGSPQRYARVLFGNDGIMRAVYGFTNEGGVGAPWEITPATGDTFTVLEQWLDLDTSGRVVERVSQEGGTLTFGDQPLYWEELDAAAGEYVIGYIVSDLDGNEVQSFTTVVVE